MKCRRAVFFDRDGTLIKHVHYLSKPEQVELEPGAAQALFSLRNAGYVCVVVTNQAAIAKGLLTEAGLVEIHQEMSRQLADAGAKVDAYYHCPLAGISGDPTIVEFHDRKPGPGMLLRAAKEMNLDLSQSWMVGDAIGDVLAGNHAGCRGMIWIGRNVVLPEDVNCRPARSLLQAAEIILEI
jgi:D-glycero-D-manno-heptose 1,7-bisphosphate phosphatase